MAHVAVRQASGMNTLLAVSFGAIVLGALMLLLVLNKYGFDTSPKGGSADNAPSLTKSLV